MPIGRLAMALALLSAGAAACADDDAVSGRPVDATESNATPTTPDAAEPTATDVSEPHTATDAEFQVRPVLETFQVGNDTEPTTGVASHAPDRLFDDAGNSYVVGPAPSIRVFSDAVVDDQLGVGVSATFDGENGAQAFNAIAQQCFAMQDTCPTGQIALVLDEVVLSALAVNTPSFPDTVWISGGFTHEEAQVLADAINAG